MSRRAKLAMTALFFVLFAWLYIHTGRLPGHARRLEFELASAAQVALDRAGLDDWARVDMDGRIAVVSGIAPNEAARAQALAAVAAAAPGGGVSRVTDQTDLRKLVSPYVFTAHLEGDGLVLEGYAPDRAPRDAIAARADRVFAGGVDAKGIEIASGVPEGADWLSAVDFAVAQLVRLRHGDLKIEDAQILIEGTAATPEVRAEVGRQLRQAPAPFEGRSNIVAMRPTGAAAARRSEAEEGASVEGAPGDEEMTLSEAVMTGDAATAGAGAGARPASRADCQTRIDALMADGTVRFSFNDAGVSATSQPLLDGVAEAARACDGYPLRIGGHTDATGDPAFNMYLSERRAQAVRDYLIGKGLDPASLVAQGFGASDPVASNASAAGRALNRRIEIEVMEPTAAAAASMEASP